MYKEWLNQVAANDVIVPENFTPLHTTGSRYDQEYEEITGFDVTVREYKHGKYSIGVRHADIR